MRYYLEIPACNLKKTQLSQNITVTQKPYMLQQTLPLVMTSLKQVSKK
jgi:hypothetical protein